MNRNELIAEITYRMKTIENETESKREEHDRIISDIVDMYQSSGKRKVGKTLISKIINIYENSKTPRNTQITEDVVFEIINLYEEIICDAMRRNEVVALHGFLKFERKRRKGHKGNDLKNDGLIDIPDFESVKVTPGNTLKNILRNSN